MTGDIDARVQALCNSPTGCAFLLTVEENDLSPEVAADLEVAMHAAAVAVSSIDIWFEDHAQTVAVALENGPRLRPLAHAILAQTAARSWFAPLERAAQWVILREDDDPVTPANLVTPSSPPSGWELYAQKPWAKYSSTVAGDTCAILAAMLHHAGDFYWEPPIRRTRLRATPPARVFEVDGPLTWRRLAMRYPAMDEQGRTVPDWGLVSADWDAVHLSLGGLLTAQQVRVAGLTGTTELQGWDSEQTAWLRWCFDEVTPLPDLAEPPEPPMQINPSNQLLFPRTSRAPQPWFGPF